MLTIRILNLMSFCKLIIFVGENKTFRFIFEHPSYVYKTSIKIFVLEAVYICLYEKSV